MTDNSGTPVPPSNQPSSPPPAPQYQPYQGEHAPSGYNAQGGVAGEDPGKTLGIIGLVLAFVMAPAGLVVSIIGQVRSKNAGFKNGFATAGIIVSSVLIVLGITIAVLFALGIGAVVTQFAEVCDGVPSGETVEVEGVSVTCP
jgi:hypothetical protein